MEKEQIKNHFAKQADAYEEFAIAQRGDLLREYPHHSDLIRRLTRDE